MERLRNFDPLLQIKIISFDDSGRIADRNRVIRNIAIDQRMAADHYPAADSDIRHDDGTEAYARSFAYLDIIADTLDSVGDLGGIRDVFIRMIHIHDRHIGSERDIIANPDAATANNVHILFDIHIISNIQARGRRTFSHDHFKPGAVFMTAEFSILTCLKFTSNNGE